MLQLQQLLNVKSTKMKKFLIIVIVAVGGYFFLKKSCVIQKLTTIVEPQITISDLQNHPSVYADSLITLHKIHVVESHTLFNYTQSKVSDGSGAYLLLLSSRPFGKGEVVDEVSGRLTVVYADNERRYEVFISDDLKPFNDLMKVIKHALVF